MKKNIYLNVFSFFTALVILTSCANQKRIVYFQKELNQSDTINVAQQYVPTIQPGDILSIPVSSLNPAASSFFNPYNSTGATMSTDNAATGGTAPLTQSSANGFLVDANGTIELPLIGSVKVGGRTTAQARDTIKNMLKTYLKEPTVNVRFLNYKLWAKFCTHQYT
jgi:polysaccharide export outer membrane protein